MRILGVGDYLDLGDMYIRLSATGHEVRVYVADPDYADVLSGMITRISDWRTQLPWIKAAGDDGLIIFENAGLGALQEELRATGYHVIGGSALGDRLEGDRAFGQDVLRTIGLPTAPVHPFTDYAKAIAFIQSQPGRYVYKHNGHHLPSTHNYVGELEDGRDVIGLLQSYARRAASDITPDFILMEHLTGVETGVGAYFDGHDFLWPACLDWEHKRFFPGDTGELTCEMGTLVTYRGAEQIFAQTLAPLAPFLRDGGYRGYINLNTIINADGIWPLEFTCRFGYPGYSILDALHRCEWDEILRGMCGFGPKTYRTSNGFAIGVVLTTPPFPYGDDASQRSKGLPIVFRGELTDAERRHLHFAEVMLRDGMLMTSGSSGYVMVVTGIGSDVETAQRSAYQLMSRVAVPNGRFRNDIGDRFRQREGALLASWGYDVIAAQTPSSAR